MPIPKIAAVTALANSLQHTEVGSTSGRPLAIVQFTGAWRWLSNFYPAPIRHVAAYVPGLANGKPATVLARADQRNGVICGTDYPTVEHAYQANKSAYHKIREEIAAAPNPAVARQLGKLVVLRPAWDGMKNGVMLELLWAKYQIPELRELLLATGDIPLVEGNHWGDRYWGVSPVPEVQNVVSGLGTPGRYGENWLGRLTMRVREEIRAETRRA